MIYPAELELLLNNRLEGTLSKEKLADLLREIQALSDEWEEVPISHREMGYSMSVNCPDICCLAEQIYEGNVFKFYRKRKAQQSAGKAVA
jgi:hypothetical protein